MYDVPSFTQEDLDRWGEEWAETLLLSHWDIDFRLVRLRETHGGAAMGECEVSDTKCLANISLMDPGDFDPANDWRYDPEQVVIHELLHIHFDPFFDGDENSQKHRDQEKVIDQISRAFIGLKRRLTPPKKGR